MSLRPRPNPVSAAIWTCRSRAAGELMATGGHRLSGTKVQPRELGLLELLLTKRLNISRPSTCAPIHYTKSVLHIGRLVPHAGIGDQVSLCSLLMYGGILAAEVSIAAGSLCASAVACRYMIPVQH